MLETKVQLSTFVDCWFGFKIEVVGKEQPWNILAWGSSQSFNTSLVLWLSDDAHHVSGCVAGMTWEATCLWPNTNNILQNKQFVSATCPKLRFWSLRKYVLLKYNFCLFFLSDPCFYSQCLTREAGYNPKQELSSWEIKVLLKGTAAALWLSMDLKLQTFDHYLTTDLPLPQSGGQVYSQSSRFLLWMRLIRLIPLSSCLCQGHVLLFGIYVIQNSVVLMYRCL